MKKQLIILVSSILIGCAYSQNLGYYKYHKKNDTEGEFDIGINKRSIVYLLNKVNDLHLKDTVISIMFYIKVNENLNVDKVEIKYFNKTESNHLILQDIINTFYTQSNFIIFKENNKIIKPPREVLISFTLFRAYYVKNQFYIKNKFLIKSKFPIDWRIPIFEKRPNRINIE